MTAASNRICAEAEVDTIIHGGVWWTDYRVRDRAYAYDPAVADSMAERGIWLDPTIGEVELHREHEAAGRPDLPPFDHWALPDVPSELEPRLGFMRDMVDRGVRFIGGMGMGMPIVTFDSVACSAQAYARLLGFEPWRAIASITVDAAAALGLGEIDRGDPARSARLTLSRSMATRSLTSPRSGGSVMSSRRDVPSCGIAGRWSDRRIPGERREMCTRGPLWRNRTGSTRPESA